MKFLIVVVSAFFASMAHAKAGHVTCVLWSNGSSSNSQSTTMTHEITNSTSSTYTDFSWSPANSSQKVTFTIFESNGNFNFQAQDTKSPGAITLYTGQLIPNRAPTGYVQGYVYRQDIAESVSWSCNFEE